MGEATVPAEQPAAGQAAWVPASDVDSSRPGHHQGAARQGPGSPVGLIWRIQDRTTFGALRRAPRVRRGPLTVAWLEGDSREPPRVGFAINRRVGGAVVRNRLRRRLREAARRAGLAPGVWFVSAQGGAVEASRGELEGWLGKAAEALAGVAA
jgi:RNase P protein component